MHSSMILRILTTGDDVRSYTMHSSSTLSTLLRNGIAVRVCSYFSEIKLIRVQIGICALILCEYFLKDMWSGYVIGNRT